MQSITRRKGKIKRNQICQGKKGEKKKYRRIIRNQKEINGKIRKGNE